MADRRTTVMIRRIIPGKLFAREGGWDRPLALERDGPPGFFQLGMTRKATAMRIPGITNQTDPGSPEKANHGEPQVAAEMKEGNGRGFLLSAQQIHRFEPLRVVARLAQAAQGGE
ncbi:MAG: hypothetical protein H6Q42_2197 [Deltaproteobacteria bacterium]|nr:hypothetical protein [Deltaproteobacteria bacterium]